MKCCGCRVFYTLHFYKQAWKPKNGHEKHKPKEVRRSKAFPLNKQLWFRVTRERSVAPDASKSYLHLHIPGGYKIYLLKRAEFNLSVLQDHLQRQLARINT